MRTCDVAVVGAGPAGSLAAITLARSGREVVLLDKAVFPRDKICGDGLTANALRILEEVGFDPASTPSWNTVSEVWISSPSGRRALFPLPSGAGSFAAVVERSELDASLVELARKAGAEVLEGRPCTGATELADRVRLQTSSEGGADGSSDGWIEARYAIGADGMWSPLRHHLGLASRSYRGEWHAFRQYARNLSGPAAEEMFVLFEADLLPGYFWSFPLSGGRANLGYGIHRSSAHSVRDMGRLWADLLRRPHVRELLGARAELEGSHRAWPIPARVDDAPLHAARTLFVGDAAMACDVLTGEGIAQAMDTGRWAAQALLAAGSDDAPLARRTYRRLVHEGLVADHRMSATLAATMRNPRAAAASIRTADLTAWTRRNFARWLFEDYPRAVVLTPKRWRRGMFTGPGAFEDVS